MAVRANVAASARRINAKVVTDPPLYSYLTQTSRVNAAAPVASGAEKPVSQYGLGRVEDRLRVVAHLSERIDRFWVEDLAELRTFVQEEMGYGLDVAVEQQLLNGSGLGEHMRGVLNTPGIQVQAFSADPVETLRRAVTKAQVAGADQLVAAMHPGTWESVALVRATTNQFLATDSNLSSAGGGAVSPPYGPTALMSWGVPVVLSVAVPVGTAIVFDPSSVVLYTDGAVRLEWDGSIGFTRNELVARCEGRFGTAVTRPDRIVSVDMTA